MKGVVFLHQVNRCTIKKNIFKFNDALPVLNNIQEVGFIDNTDYYGNVQRASAIFVDEYSNNIQIVNNTFINNTIG